MYFHQCPSIFIHLSILIHHLELLRLLHFLLPVPRETSEGHRLRDTEVTDLRSEDCRGEGVVPWILYPGMDGCHGVMGIEPTLPGPKSWLSGGSLISIHKGESCLHLVLGSHLWRLVESHDACHGWDPICGANTAARAFRMVGQWACIKMDTQVMIPAYHWVTGSAWTLNSCKVRDKVG